MLANGAETCRRAGRERLLDADFFNSFRRRSTLLEIAPEMTLTGPSARA